MQKTELGQAREAACRSLLQEVRTIEADTRTGFPGRRLLETMLAFAERHGSLFPDADFDPPRAHGRVHPLSNGLDTPYGLYLGVTRPGKEAAPHCHGVWSVSVGLAGQDLHQFWRLLEQTSSTTARVEETYSVTIGRGTGMVMSGQGIHSTRTLEKGEARMLQLFARPLDQCPRVVFYHPAWGTRRALPQSTGATLAGRG
jgi:hypothetical protein